VLKRTHHSAICTGKLNRVSVSHTGPQRPSRTLPAVTIVQFQSRIISVSVLGSLYANCRRVRAHIKLVAELEQEQIARRHYSPGSCLNAGWFLRTADSSNALDRSIIWAPRIWHLWNNLFWFTGFCSGCYLPHLFKRSFTIINIPLFITRFLFLFFDLFSQFK
jgi:hypothetical protein